MNTKKNTTAVDKNPSPSFVFIADVVIAALACRRAEGLIFWHVLRGLARVDGAVDRARICEAAHLLRWHRRKVERILRSGSGAFWRPGRERGIWLVAANKVANQLGVAKARTVVHVPIRDLRGSASIVRARIFMRAVAALRRGVPISNVVLAEMAGRSTRTIKTWKSNSGVRVMRNFVLVAPFDRHALVTDYRHFGGPPSLRVVRHRGRRWLARRIPDSLVAHRGGGGFRSRLRRLNRALRAQSPVASGRSPTLQRIYLTRDQDRGAAERLPHSFPFYQRLRAPSPATPGIWGSPS